MFYSELKVKAIRGTGYRELLNVLIYETVGGIRIVVPKGFKTNYASIPRFLRWFIDQDGPEIRDISVVHDYLYSRESIYQIDRSGADAILLTGMIEQGGDIIGHRVAGSGKPVWLSIFWMKLLLFRLFVKAILVWLAVRLFGGLHYRKTSRTAPDNQQKQEKEALGFLFRALMFMAVFIILTPMVLSGCSVTNLAKAKAGQYVQAYCGQTPAERAAFRALINESIYPNTINLECIDDGR